jgi:hypothetical protein
LISGTMKLIYSKEDVTDDDLSVSSTIKSEPAASRGAKTQEALNDAWDDCQRMKLYQLLDEWEEPDRHSDENVSLSTCTILTGIFIYYSNISSS